MNESKNPVWNFIINVNYMLNACLKEYLCNQTRFGRGNEDEVRSSPVRLNDLLQLSLT